MTVRRCVRAVVAVALVVGVSVSGDGPAGAGVAPPPFITTWGTPGSGSGQFDYPFGVAVAPNGNVYVADTDNHRVQVFGPSGGFVGMGGTLGSGDGQFDRPYGVAVAPNGDVYVADTNNHRVQVFNPSGGFVTAWGTLGSGDGQFISPSGVAVAPNGDVYVTDYGNHRVQVFTSLGGFVTEWGTPGSGDGQFDRPDGVAVAPNGHVYVADTGNRRVQVFTASGGFVTKWGSAGIAEGRFISLGGVAVAPNGDVYVTDYGNPRVQVFSPSGGFVTEWGTRGSGDGQFDRPFGVAVDRDGIVYVTDAGNSRVQVFGPAPALTATMTGAPVVMVGREIAYELAVTNTGNVALTGVRAVDAEVPGCSQRFNGAGNVALGATTMLACSYLTTAEDVGVFRNSAYVTSNQHTLTATNVVRTRVVTPRPDGLIRRTGTATFVGDNVYNTSGAGQTVTRSAARGTTARFDIEVANDSAATDSFTVRAAGAARAGYTVSYFLGATDITAQVVAGTYPVTELAPGGSVVIQARVRVGATAPAGSRVTRTLTTASTADPAVRDTVKATVTRA